MIEITEKYTQPEVVAFWQQFSLQGLQACEAMMLARYAPPPATVLDLGCGTGRAGMALAPLGYTVAGLDITWAMVQAARGLYLEAGIRPLLWQADMRHIPCPTASYDVVLILIAALQHIPGRPDRQATLAEIGRVLRPGGVLLLALDNIAPALTCYGWWSWRKARALGRRFAGKLDVAVDQMDEAAVRLRAKVGPSVNGTATAADDLLVSRRQQVSGVGWHLRGVARTLRWRTWQGWVDRGRRAGLMPGQPGDTAIYQVSLTPTPGRVYYHLYQHDELVEDATAGGFVLVGYHSGRELNEGQSFAPRVRQLDKQVLYAFRRS